MSSQFNDSDDDVRLHTRRSSADAYPVEGGRASEIAENKAPDREVTLNTGIVLALFFALALLCAVFFGFGYSIGHKSATGTVAAEPESTTVVEDASAASAAKPVPGSPASVPVPGYVPSGTAEKTPAIVVKMPSVDAPDEAASKAELAKAASKTTAKEAAPVRPAPVVRIAAPDAAASSTTPTSAMTPSGTSYVQIAAVSHQEDADVLLSALRRRGYAVLTRSDANDKLIHVQIGPFANRKEAEAMRQKLAGDGYNAFIK